MSGVQLKASITDASGLPWAVFICKACGLLYDESKGDEDSGLAPGTRFADIADDWVCPLCGVTKADFEPYVNEPIQSARRSVNNAPRGTRNPGVVIVGAGRAGWQMAQTLRAQDAVMPITVVTACNGDVYDKPLLSIAMARGIAVDKLPRETGAEAAHRLNVTLLAHTQAIRITPASRQLRTTRGTLAYQHLVLAHGAESKALSQFPAALCWRINHLQVYAEFRRKLGPTAQRVAVIGAGLIGCELANDLALAGHSVTLLDVAERPLAAALTPQQSEQLLAAWSPIPLAFAGKSCVTDVKHILLPSGRHEKQLTIKHSQTQADPFGGGQTLAVDHIVLAAGLQTPNKLAASAGLAWNNGIDLQPETLATNVQGIYALGDCVAIGGSVSRYIEPIGRQAKTVASRILGQPLVPYNILHSPLRIKTSSLPFTV